VILGAGLDARAFGLVWPAGTRLFELDMPYLFAFKEDVIAERGFTPRYERVVIPIDLRDDWPAALEARAFVADRPSAWLLEGLLMYLAEAQRDRLFARIGMWPRWAVAWRSSRRPGR